MRLDIIVLGLALLFAFGEVWGATPKKTAFVLTGRTAAGNASVFVLFYRDEAGLWRLPQQSTATLDDAKVSALYGLLPISSASVNNPNCTVPTDQDVQVHFAALPGDLHAILVEMEKHRKFPFNKFAAEARWVQWNNLQAAAGDVVPPDQVALNLFNVEGDSKLDFHANTDRMLRSASFKAALNAFLAKTAVPAAITVDAVPKKAVDYTRYDFGLISRYVGAERYVLLTTLHAPRANQPSRLFLPRFEGIVDQDAYFQQCQAKLQVPKPPWNGHHYAESSLLLKGVADDGTELGSKLILHVHGQVYSSTAHNSATCGPQSKWVRYVDLAAALKAAVNANDKDATYPMTLIGGGSQQQFALDHYQMLPLLTSHHAALAVDYPVPRPNAGVVPLRRVGGRTYVLLNARHVAPGGWTTFGGQVDPEDYAHKGREPLAFGASREAQEESGGALNLQAESCPHYVSPTTQGHLFKGYMCLVDGGLTETKVRQFIMGHSHNEEIGNVRWVDLQELVDYAHGLDLSKNVAFSADLTTLNEFDTKTYKAHYRLYNSSIRFFHMQQIVRDLEQAALANDPSVVRGFVNAHVAGAMALHVGALPVRFDASGAIQVGLEGDGGTLKVATQVLPKNAGYVEFATRGEQMAAAKFGLGGFSWFKDMIHPILNYDRLATNVSESYNVLVVPEAACSKKANASTQWVSLTDVLPPNLDPLALAMLTDGGTRHTLRFWRNFYLKHDAVADESFPAALAVLPIAAPPPSTTPPVVHPLQTPAVVVVPSMEEIRTAKSPADKPAEPPTPDAMETEFTEPPAPTIVPPAPTTPATPTTPFVPTVSTPISIPKDDVYHQPDNDDKQNQNLTKPRDDNEGGEKSKDGLSMGTTMVIILATVGGAVIIAIIIFFVFRSRRLTIASSA